MSSSLFSIGLSGINAAQTGIITTSHNIANASTPGYTRQQIVQTTNSPQFTGAGYLGTGTNVSTILRQYSSYLSAQVLSAQAGVSSADSYGAQIAQIDNLLADANAGLAPSMNAFFSGVQEVAANPSSIASRQSMLSSAQSLVNRFQSLNDQLNQIRNGVNSQISASVANINSYARQIADLNQRIINAQAFGPNQPPNDLMDQRDQLVADLNKEVRATASVQADGTYSVFIGNGQPLVVGTQVSTLQAVAAPDDISRTVVVVQTGSGSPIFVPESLLSNGGNLGGLLSFRSETLDAAQNALGRIGIAMATTLNDQHQLGQDLNGNAGGNLFTVGAPSVFPNANNATQATTVSAQIIDSNYRVTFGAAGAYTVTRLSDNTSVATGTAAAGATQLNIDGIPMTINNGNTASAGDAFIIQPGNAAGSRVVSETGNTGSAVLDSAGSNIQALTTSDYRLTYTAANTFTLVRLSDNASWTGTGATPAAALADLATKQQPGFMLSLSGTAPTVGDNFLIEPTRTGASSLSVAITDPSNIAAAAPIRTSSALTNTGTGTISAGVIDYRPTTLQDSVTITFTDATHFNVQDVTTSTTLASGVTYNPTTGTAVNLNGWTVNLAGNPARGDVFNVGPNSNGVSDNRNILALGQLQSRKILDGGSSSYTTAYSQVVSSVGTKDREIQVTGKAQQSLLDNATSAQQSFSGVNLDEEAANLMRYQQAYQASAKVLATISKLLDSILALN